MLCPLCHRSYDNPEQSFCNEDGTLLVDTPPIQQAAVQQTNQIGTMLAERYLIQGLIGKGGMAGVYLAEDMATREQVAVKILGKDQVRSAAMRERFLREIDVAKQIGHPNIVRILDAGERPDRSPFIVLEYLMGESLGDLLNREGRVSETFAIELVKRAASALAAAHAVGVIHRDIKPDNLFLVGDGSILKVVDFGMAKLQESTFTATGVTLGTVPYMAPEQAVADPVDGRTDIYGLGITFYKLLTGRLPFDHADDAELVAHHLFAPLPLPSLRCPGLDPRIERVVLAATRKRPDNRYPTMRRMLEDIGRIAGDRPGEIEAPEPATLPDLYDTQNPMARRAVRHLRTLVH